MKKQRGRAFAPHGALTFRRATCSGLCVGAETQVDMVFWYVGDKIGAITGKLAEDLQS